MTYIFTVNPSQSIPLVRIRIYGKFIDDILLNHRSGYTGRRSLGRCRRQGEDVC